jgi:hypothetical protein
MDSILTLIIQWKENFDSVVENGEQSGGASVLEIEADRLLDRARNEIEELAGQSLERFYQIEQLTRERDELVRMIRLSLNQIGKLKPYAPIEEQIFINTTEKLLTDVLAKHKEG